MSMFLFLQAQIQNAGDSGYGGYASEDVADPVPPGTSVSYVLIAGEDVKPWNLNRYALLGDATVKPPIVSSGSGILVDEFKTEGVVPPQSSTSSFVPPQLGEKALLMILTKEEREYVLGDLAEEFALYQSKYGVRFAKVWYYKQVVSSVWPILRRTLRLGAFVWFAEWLRRHI